MIADSVDTVLIAFLEAQRARALAVVADLDADQLTTSVLPSGWTPLGMIEHLGHAERHWFQEVALGSAAPLPWPDDPDEHHGGPFTTTRQADAVFAFYRDQIERANAVLAETPLSAPPLGRHNQGDADQVTDLRFIVMHMIEETARHLGHLDAARELLDGRVGLGQDDL
ncbi:DinB family protein [Planotetraspora thailandica]|nr:DinB family protein [Planotetraspora thailandica]